jgi:hypothetical protein
MSWWRWVGGDGLVEMGWWRWIGGDGSVEMGEMVGGVKEMSDDVACDVGVL